MRVLKVEVSVSCTNIPVASTTTNGGGICIRVYRGREGSLSVIYSKDAVAPAAPIKATTDPKSLDGHIADFTLIFQGLFRSSEYSQIRLTQYTPPAGCTKSLGSGTRCSGIRVAPILCSLFSPILRIPISWNWGLQGGN